MTFQELYLAIALRRHGNMGMELMSKPIGVRHRYASGVYSEWVSLTDTTEFPWTWEDICRIRETVRKSTSNGLKAEVAERFGVKCFWEGRGKGNCSVDAQLGHILPRSKGGKDEIGNLIIECGRHNAEHGSLSFDEYVAMETTNDQNNCAPVHAQSSH